MWDLAQHADDLSKPARCVVAAGGDGTVGAVLNALPSRNIPVAVMPLGNENLLAKAFGYTGDPSILAAAIARNKTKQIDLAKTNGRYFSLMISAGFDAEVVHRVAQWRTAGKGLKRIARHSYLTPILKAVKSYTYPAVELEADGQIVRGSMAMVINVPGYAAGLRFAPHACSNDGLLNWVMFQTPGRLRLMQYLIAIIRGRHLNRSDVKHGTARSVILRSDHVVPLQIDGDTAGTTPATVQIEPSAIAMIDMDGF
jgi:diacylglycerol kinase family enzyme